MKVSILITALVLVAALSAGTTCPVPAASGKEIVVSSPLGSGSVTLLREGSRIVVEIDNAALQSLPRKDTVVDLVANIGPFRLVEIDWHPHGHEPKGVYDVPHFDAHFYVIAKAERDAIAFSPPGAVARPDAGLVPAGYVSDGTVVPSMGMHFVPATAPELHGRPFMATQIWGYNEGHLAFIEAMFSLRFVQSNGSIFEPLAKASGVDAGSLPSTMSVHRDGNGYDIVLTR